MATFDLMEVRSATLPFRQASELRGDEFLPEAASFERQPPWSTASAGIIYSLYRLLCLRR